MKVADSLFFFFFFECTFTFTEMKASYRNEQVSQKMLLQVFVLYDWKSYPEKRGSHV